MASFETKSRFVKIWFRFCVLTFHYKARYIGEKEWVSFYFPCIQYKSLFMSQKEMNTGCRQLTNEDILPYVMDRKYQKAKCEVITHQCSANSYRIYLILQWSTQLTHHQTRLLSDGDTPSDIKHVPWYIIVIHDTQHQHDSWRWCTEYP